jgi:hypothetical protein
LVNPPDLTIEKTPQPSPSEFHYPVQGLLFKSDALSENPQKVKVELGLKKKNIRFPFWLPIPIYSQQKTQ